MHKGFGGEVYIDGSLVCTMAGIPEITDVMVTPLVEECERLGSIGESDPISITMKSVRIDTRQLLSLVFGRKITNNWLKMHGGIMVRNGGKKKWRKN